MEYLNGPKRHQENSGSSVTSEVSNRFQTFEIVVHIHLPKKLNANYLSAARVEINMKHLMISAHLGL